MVSLVCAYHFATTTRNEGAPPRADFLVAVRSMFIDALEMMWFHLMGLIVVSPLVICGKTCRNMWLFAVCTGCVFPVCVAYAVPKGIPFDVFECDPNENMWPFWRKLTVISVASLTTCVLAIVQRRIGSLPGLAEQTNTLHYTYMAIGLMVEIAAVVATFVTAPPMVRVWVFVFRPWRAVVVSAISRRRVPDLPPEEWVVFSLVLWFLARRLSTCADSKLERRCAERRVEEILRLAQRHPFYAELQRGFGTLYQFSDKSMSKGSSNAIRNCSDSVQVKQRNLSDKRRQRLDQDLPCGFFATQFKVKVRRQQLLEDSWVTLLSNPISSLLAPDMFVSFSGENGVDAGGITCDWFDSVAITLTRNAKDLHSSSPLTTAVDHTLIPRPNCEVVEEGCAGELPHDGPTDGQSPGSRPSASPQAENQLRSLVAFGRFLGLAVFRHQPLPLSLSFVVCKHLLGVPICMSDVQRLDPEFYRGRVEQVLKEGGLEELRSALDEPLTFVSAPTQHRGDPRELKPDGGDIAVTSKNSVEYVQLLCEDYLCGGIRQELQCLLQGFWDVLPQELLRNCEISPRELSLMISGIACLDAGEWRRYSRTCEGELNAWFWQIVSDFNKDERCMLLHFATGSSRLPVGGFQELRPPFTVVEGSGSPEHLPHAHTCANQLVLHKYTSKEQLREKLRQAIVVAQEFGLA